MKSKMFRDLKKGDRFLHQASPYDYRSPLVWDIAADNPKPLDDYDPSGMWKIGTTNDKAFERPDTIVAVEDQSKAKVEGLSSF